jgi:tetrahydromethanopterin S-methyltransferase subunit A
VGDAGAPVAVCALTDARLMREAVGLPGVAIAGCVATANLGIEKIIRNVTANPAIRFVVVCGPDSPLFHPGQTLVALANAGVDDERRVRDAEGYLPVLRGVSRERIERFRRQVELVDRIGEDDIADLSECLSDLVGRNPGRYTDASGVEPVGNEPERFVTIKPGGRSRDPLGYDPAGYFVITLDRPDGRIVLRHYRSDNTPAHQMQGHSTEPMLAGLLRDGLITQLGHAGYLGAELAKAETALRLDLPYDQDRPLRNPPTT